MANPIWGLAADKQLPDRVFSQIVHHNVGFQVIVPFDQRNFAMLRSELRLR